MDLFPVCGSALRKVRVRWQHVVAEIKTEEEDGKVSCDRFGGVSELILGNMTYEKDLPGKLTMPSLFIPIKPTLVEDMTHRCTPRNSKMARWPD
jgi:hypothetical protein